MYKVKKAVGTFFLRLGYVLTYPAAVIWKAISAADRIGVGEFFSSILLMVCIYQIAQAVRHGASMVLCIFVYLIIFGIVGRLGSLLIDFIVHLLVNALHPINLLHTSIKKSLKRYSERTMEDYIYEMRKQKAYSVTKR